MNVDIEFKSFKVAAVSSNYNSFGLRGIVLIAEDGEAWEAAAGDIHGYKRGKTLRLGADRHGEYDWAHHGFEIPRRLSDAPRNVVNEVW